MKQKCAAGRTNRLPVAASLETREKMTAAKPSSCRSEHLSSTGVSRRTATGTASSSVCVFKGVAFWNCEESARVRYLGWMVMPIGSWCHHLTEQL
jgi:hypothetical protein